MAQAIGNFSIADAAESELFTFDFVNDLPTGDYLESAVWSCTVAVGVDPDAASRLMGSPAISGTQTTIRAGGFLPGVQYVLAAVAMTAADNVLELWAYITGEAVGC